MKPVYAAVLSLLMLAPMAHAQDAKPEAETTVTVTGKKQKGTRKIDRTVYDQTDNPAAQSGTVADVLKTVPSVSVTPDGEVSLRGDRNVQVYINGKPAAEMAPEVRAATLQSMSGGDIASVEVVTNPSAQYNANGGGIINIVLKKNRKPGMSGALIANLGNRERDNATLSGAWNFGRWSMNGRAGFRHDRSIQTKTSDLTWADPATGTRGRSTQYLYVPARRQSTSAALGLGYRLSESDDISTNLTYSQNQAHNRNDEYHRDYDATGTLIRDYDRRSAGPRHQTNSGLRLDYDHRGKAGDALKLTFNHSQTINSRDKSYRNLFVVPVRPDTIERLLTKDGRRLDQLSADYVRPVGTASQISAGVDIQRQQDRFYNYQAAVDPLTAAETVNSLTTNRFVADQALDAAYVTFQTMHGKWTMLAGLRAETLHTRASQATTGTVHETRYRYLNPSLHLSYGLDEARRFKASFSDSMQRPSPADLNPFIVYWDAQNISAGNPDLKPQGVTSFELGYDFDREPLSYGLTLYYRTSRDTVTDYAYFVDGAVLLTTRRNSGKGRSAGLGYSGSGQLSPNLKYELSLNAFHAELEAADLNGRLRQSGASYTGNTTLTYAKDDNDTFTLNGNFQGRGLTSQGWRSGFSAVDLSWTHDLTPNLVFAVNINDIGNAGRIRTHTRTASVSQVSSSHALGRTIFIGLTWRFAKKPPGD